MHERQRMQHAGRAVGVQAPAAPAPDEAGRRVDVVLRRSDLSSDRELQERLLDALTAWHDRIGASQVSVTAADLYRLLADPRAGAPTGAPIRPQVLRRALLLAMTRPSDDPCWHDYQAIVVDTRDRSFRIAQEAYRSNPWRRLRRALARTEPLDPAAWAGPIAESRRQFSATWATA
jgi:hypothetical protein